MLKISDMPSRSSNKFIYSGSMTVTPCSLITWTTGGEFYRNQIEEGHYKKMFILDTKLTFNISKRIEVSASITNLLNKKSTVIPHMAPYRNMNVQTNSVDVNL